MKNGRAFGINKFMSVTDYEKAVLAGEIKSLNTPLTRDEAIAKLEESKDLLDLGIIEDAAYELLKAELTLNYPEIVPIIFIKKRK